MSFTLSVRFSFALLACVIRRWHHTPGTALCT